MTKTQTIRAEVAKLEFERDEALRGLELARETAQTLVVSVVQVREASLREAEDILQNLLDRYRQGLDDDAGPVSFYAGAREALEAGVRAITDLRENPEDYSSWHGG